MENSVKFPQKIKNRITVWSSNATSEYSFQGNNSTNSNNLCTPGFTVALFTIPKICKYTYTTIFHFSDFDRCVMITHCGCNLQFPNG